MTERARGLDRTGLRARLTGMLVALVTASVLTLGLAAVAAFDRAVEPELANRTRLIGTIIRTEIQRAIELGIPFDALAGLDSYLAETLARFDEVERIVVTSRSGEVIAAAERPASPSILGRTGMDGVIVFRRGPFVLPILHGNDFVGEIAVETNPRFVQTRLREVFLDVTVIAIVAMLIALELALAVAIGSVGKPLERVSRLLAEQRDGDFRHCIRPGGLSGLGRAAVRLNDHAEDLAARFAALSQALRVAIERVHGVRIAVDRPVRLRLSDFNDIRLALFLFSFATEIAAAFLPIYARAAARPGWLTPELAAAAPLMLYLAGVALLSPFAGALAHRFGPRRLFLASVPPTVLALVAMGLSDSLAAITVWRGVMAVFYATATVACQEYAIRAAGGRGSARPVGAFVAVVYGGVFCGAAAGGVIAGRFGIEAAFHSGAAIAVLAGALAMSAMRGRAGDPAAASPAAAVTPRRVPGVRVIALLLCITMPMNAATAILVWYLTPLELAAGGSGPADIARAVMLYYLAVVLFGPTVTRLSEGRAGPALLVVVGAMVSGAALLLPTVWSGFWAVTAAVAGLGIGHTLIRAPQYTLALRITGASGPGLGAMRVLERVGALVGLVASALAVAEAGAAASLRALGLVVLAGGVAYAIVELAGRLRRASVT